MTQFMPDVSDTERKRILEENAVKIESGTYQKPLSEDELIVKKDELAENYINLNQKEEELKSVKDEFKAVMDPIKDDNKRLLSEIKTKQETVDGNQYFLPNFESSMMEVYDDEGNLIYSRRLRPDERQQSIFKIAK